MLIISSFSNKLIAQSNSGTEQENPSINATIGGIISGAISKGRLLATDSVGCTNKEYVITSFTFSCLKVVKGEKLAFDYQGKGNKFTPEMIEAMKGIEVGGTISFENIKAFGPDKKTRSLPSVILKVN
jgi:hypothetical protein